MLSNDQCFFEGDTERNVLEGLKVIPRQNPTRIKDEGGKSKINERIKNTLGPNLGSENIRCLILRDLDSHVNETSAAIRQSVIDCFKNLFRERGFDERLVTLNVHEKFPNLYLFETKIPNIKVALHIAEDKYLANFKNSTIDDYVLDLALRAETVQQLIADKRDIRKKEFLACLPVVADEDEATKIGKVAQAIIKKVVEEIPELLRKNNFPEIKEAKQYLQFYAAIAREPKSPPVIAKDIIKFASEKDKQQVLASLLAAIEFISE